MVVLPRPEARVLAALREAAGGELPPGTSIRVLQASEIVTQTGRSRFYSVVGSHPVLESSGLAFSGLFRCEDDCASPTLVLQSDLEEIRIMASLDLDRDGEVELLVETRYDEGEGVHVMRFSGGELRRIGGWGCEI